MKKIVIVLALIFLLAGTAAAQVRRHLGLRPRHLHTSSPSSLKPGDRVALLSPAYYIDSAKVDSAAMLLRLWGFEPVVAPNVGKVYHGKYAGTVEERVSDLRWVLNDTSIKAIICNRGGYGTLHYIDQISPREWRKHPKWLVGYSDITTLHGLLTRAGIMSIHGPMASSLDAADSSSIALRDLLMGSVPQYHLPPHPDNIKGRATGTLVGGNLCTLVPLLGTGADATLGRDIILFLEEVGESMHNIDRQFRILEMNGVLDRCKGVILGEFTDCGNEFTGQSVESMLRQRIAGYGIPLLCGFPAGHGSVNSPLVMGSPVTIDVGDEASTVRFGITAF